VEWCLSVNKDFRLLNIILGEEAEDPYEIYEEIIKKDISYPNYLKDKKAKKLMD